MMSRDKFAQYQLSREKFTAWESTQPEIVPAEKRLHLIGVCVDFFLARHPQKIESPNIQGIQNMRKSLAFLSSFS